MANITARTWVDGETVDAQKMNTISSDLDALNNGKLEKPASEGTADQVLHTDGAGGTYWGEGGGSGGGTWGTITGNISSQTDLMGVTGRLGNAIAMKGWNQLVKNGNFESAGTWVANNATLSVSGNVGSVAISGTDGNITQHITPIVGHKYLISADVKPSAASMGIRLIYNTSEWSVSAYLEGTTEWSRMSAVGVMGSGTNLDVFYIRGINGSSFQVKNANVIDLTALFGAGNEPSSVEEFRAMFPADYYPYCSGAWADLLWENASPTSAFASQTLAIDVTPYRFLAYRVRPVASQANSVLCIAINDSNGSVLAIAANNAGAASSRPVNASSSGVWIGNGSSVSNNTLTQDNTRAIPVEIYGIR